MNIAIIGTGLIGGSLAIALKENGIAGKIIGVEKNKDHAAKALELGLVDEIKEMEAALLAADVVILAVPVDAAEQLILPILNQINRQVIIDVGSTKSAICQAA
ncbi:MAG: prephenate dehydrogenase/arogenate dehydrogenase family protein, partial [Ginsengibacter sp.]